MNVETFPQEDLMLNLKDTMGIETPLENDLIDLDDIPHSEDLPITSELQKHLGINNDPVGVAVNSDIKGSSENEQQEWLCVL